MTKENLKLVVAILSFMIVTLFVNNLGLTKRIANRVINDLKRDYVPGPYEPGFDPDKVPPRSPK